MCKRKIDAETVRRLARAAGLEIAPARAETLAPYVNELLAADASLARLDMGDAPAAGAPWGEEGGRA